MKVSTTWWETEAVTTEYTATISVPEEFSSWDEDEQRDYLDDRRLELDQRTIRGYVVQGEVTDSGIDEWSIT